MKHLLIVVLAITIALGMATSAKATTIYLDTFVDEKGATGSLKWDANLSRIKADIPLSEEWKIGADYMWGDFNDTDNTKYNSYALKVGYAVFTNDAAKFDFCLGYHHLTFDYPGPDNDLNTTTLGFDFDLKISERWGLNASCDWGFGDYSSSHKTVNDMLKYDARIQFLITENIGLSVGYYDNYFKPTSYPRISNYGATAGLVFKF